MRQRRQKLVLAAIVFLDVAIETSVVDGNGGASGQVECQCKIVRAKATLSARCAQRDRPQRPAAG